MPHTVCRCRFRHHQAARKSLIVPSHDTARRAGRFGVSWTPCLRSPARARFARNPYPAGRRAGRRVPGGGRRSPGLPPDPAGLRADAAGPAAGPGRRAGDRRAVGEGRGGAFRPGGVQGPGRVLRGPPALGHAAARDAGHRHRRQPRPRRGLDGPDPRPPRGDLRAKSHRARPHRGAAPRGRGGAGRRGDVRRRGPPRRRGERGPRLAGGRRHGVPGLHRRSPAGSCTATRRSSPRRPRSSRRRAGRIRTWSSSRRASAAWPGPGRPSTSAGPARDGHGWWSSSRWRRTACSPRSPDRRARCARRPDGSRPSWPG